jgi:diphosphomevalonate decarboxylase
VTLSREDLRTHTTATCSASYPTDAGDTLILNGEPSPLTTPRTVACLQVLRAYRRALEAQDDSLPKLSTYPLRLASSNNFPTAAGLASSAAGFAALVRAIADLYALPLSPTELSRIARQGSGSACRSVLGGYVSWEMGARADGEDSQAFEVAPASHWPDMRAAILVVSAAKKGVPSSTGMQATVATSTLFQQRITTTVPKRMEEMKAAIMARDFEAFARTTMADSNSFHATCLDTEPPIFYMNDVSRAAIRAVEVLNETSGRRVAAYTFDAGPNAVIYYLEKDEKEVLGFLKGLVGSAEGWEGPRGAGIAAVQGEQTDEKTKETLKTGVNRVILTSVGEGPITTENHLVDEAGKFVS